MELKAGGDITGAIAAFRRAIALKPDFEKAHYGLGIALRTQGDSAGDHEELDQLNELQSFRAHLAQAKLLIVQGVESLKKQQLDDALSFFQQAIVQSPELPTGHYYLGVALGSQRRSRTRRRRLPQSSAIETRLCSSPH